MPDPWRDGDVRNFPPSSQDFKYKSQEEREAATQLNTDVLIIWVREARSHKNDVYMACTVLSASSEPVVDKQGGIEYRYTCPQGGTYTGSWV